MNAVDLVEDAGFEAVEAANSKQAVRVLESRSDIGIILSDIHMPPGIDGMALVAIVHDRAKQQGVFPTTFHISTWARTEAVPFCLHKTES